MSSTCRTKTLWVKRSVGAAVVSLLGQWMTLCPSPQWSLPPASLSSRVIENKFFSPYYRTKSFPNWEVGRQSQLIFLPGLLQKLDDNFIFQWGTANIRPCLTVVSVWSRGLRYGRKEKVLLFSDGRSLHILPAWSVYRPTGNGTQSKAFSLLPSDNVETGLQAAKRSPEGRPELYVFRRSLVCHVHALECLDMIVLYVTRNWY